MAHLLVRAGFVVTLVGGLVAASAVPAAAAGGGPGDELPPIKYQRWCYVVEDESPYTPTTSACTPPV